MRCDESSTPSSASTYSGATITWAGTPSPGISLGDVHGDRTWPIGRIAIARLGSVLTATISVFIAAPRVRTGAFTEGDISKSRAAR
jgi:hypothetical protein